MKEEMQSRRRGLKTERTENDKAPHIEDNEAAGRDENYYQEEFLKCMKEISVTLAAIDSDLIKIAKHVGGILSDM